MKITIVEDPHRSETEITIVCSKMTEELNRLVANLTAAELTFSGKKGDETFFIPVKDIYYFESVDGTVFMYTANDTYESPLKLYQAEEALKHTRFSRISKTVIADLDKTVSIKRAEGRRLAATLVNGEKLVVSRQYVSRIKKILGVS